MLPKLELPFLLRWFSKLSGSSPRGRRTFLAAVLALTSCWATAMAQDPIGRVHGGSTTLFSMAKWNHEPTGPGYCAEFPNASSQHGVVPQTSEVSFGGFFSNVKPDAKGARAFNDTTRDENGPFSAEGSYRIEIRGHAEAERGIFQASGDGITLHALPTGCDGKTKGYSSLHIKPYGRAGFYKDSLVTTEIYKDNKRFASKCTRDRDRCERMADVQVFRGESQAPERHLLCPDGACVIYIGPPGTGARQGLQVGTPKR